MTRQFAYGAPPGIGHTPSYQVSGYPYLTGSSVVSGSQFTARLPKVSSHIKVQTVDASGGGQIRVHFGDSGSANTIPGKHWWSVVDGQPFEADLKCSTVYVSHESGPSVEFRVFAELTNIPTGSMPALTGSGIDE